MNTTQSLKKERVKIELDCMYLNCHEKIFRTKAEYNTSKKWGRKLYCAPHARENSQKQFNRSIKKEDALSNSLYEDPSLEGRI